MRVGRTIASNGMAIDNIFLRQFGETHDAAKTKPQATLDIVQHMVAKYQPLNLVRYMGKRSFKTFGKFHLPMDIKNTTKLKEKLVRHCRSFHKAKQAREEVIDTTDPDLIDLMSRLNVVEEDHEDPSESSDDDDDQ